MKNIKKLVQEKYGQIAKNSTDGKAKGCCGETSGSSSSMDYSIMADDYSHLQGYNKDADLHLGCGLPTEFAGIQPGDVVVDLGSGAGNDCFVARAETGENGKVIGIDFTSAMIFKAKQNADKLGYANVSFIEGDIEHIPLPDNTADVVVSNCVFNLVPDKEKAFLETLRILKPGGHFSISDIVIEGNLPEGLKKDAELYAGCVAGAIKKDDYLAIIERSGFEEVAIQHKKPIELPDSLLNAYLTTEEQNTFSQKTGIFSITVYGRKPLK